MGHTLRIDLNNLEETRKLGCIIGENANPGDIVTLSGDLGAGKTTLTQSIGKGLEVPSSYYITSPTFNLLQEYPGRLPLFHMDLYRLSSVEEFEDLGFEEYLYGKGLTVIEWPDRLGDLIPEDRLEIELIIRSENSRSAFLTNFGNYTIPTSIQNLVILSKF